MASRRWVNIQGGAPGDRYKTIDVHPEAVTWVLNSQAKEGWGYKAMWSNMADGHGWQRLLLERDPDE